MHISSYYDCSFCAVYMQFICSVSYEIMKCYMQTTILHIHSTEVRPKAKSQVKPKPKKHNKNQKPKAKSQVKPKPKAKSQMGMQIGSKLQQIARKSEILVPKCSKYKPEARNRRNQKLKAKSQKPNGHANWLQTAANSTQIRDFGSKMQQIQARSQKPKEPEAKSQKPEARSQKPEAKKKSKKKYPSNPKTCLELKTCFFARTVQKKQVEND